MPEHIMGERNNMATYNQVRQNPFRDKQGKDPTYPPPPQISDAQLPLFQDFTGRQNSTQNSLRANKSMFTLQWLESVYFTSQQLKSISL